LDPNKVQGADYECVVTPFVSSSSSAQTKHDQNSPALSRAVTEPTHLSISGNRAT